MINTLIGRKIDQIQKFLADGKRIPVTVIHVTDNAVLQVKTVDRDAYTAVQLGFGTKKHPTKPIAGHSKKAGFDTSAAFVREVRLADEEAPTIGEILAVDAIFQPGDIVEVSGTSKGKGFAGVVKRHNFRGGPKTHGQSDRERAPGSIGQTTTPGRVYKGKRMAGRMGSERVTVTNLTVIAVDAASKTLLVAGLVPGHKQAIVMVTKTGARKKFVELLGEKEKREALEAKKAEKEVEDPMAASQGTANVATPVVEEIAEETKETNEASADKEVLTEEKVVEEEKK